jgi:hypothetical protein
MTFYDVTLYGSKVAGNATGVKAVWKALDVVDKWYAVDPELVRNEPRCGECALTGTYEGQTATALYHTLLIREQVARDIELCGDFVWSKKKGIGRRIPREYLDQIVQDGKETWFSLYITEI